jgi:hypothetical protein
LRRRSGDASLGAALRAVLTELLAALLLWPVDGDNELLDILDAVWLDDEEEPLGVASSS